LDFEFLICADKFSKKVEIRKVREASENKAIMIIAFSKIKDY